MKACFGCATCTFVIEVFHFIILQYNSFTGRADPDFWGLNEVEVFECRWIHL